MTRVARIAFIVGVLTFFLLAACETAEEPSPTRTSPSITPTILATPTPGVASGLTPAQVTRVVDGDTIEVEIGGVEYDVRYIGIDTPETVHPSKPVECLGQRRAPEQGIGSGQDRELEKDVSETDRFGRLLRYVWVGEEMVNAVLVRDGYAQSSTYPPDVRHQEMFVDLQRQAREAGRGLWGAVCTSPTAAPVGGAGGCEFSIDGQPAIKGNISQSSGERIYHVPGQRYYDQTVIDEPEGERWFCTEQEAVEAGWRKAQG
jgi:micrococcal nuclease